MNKEDKITMDKYVTGEIVAVESQPIKLVGNPQERIKQGREAAKALMTVAQPVMIQGNPYLLIGDWQTIGSFYGLFAGADEAEPVSIDGIDGFRAKAVVRTSDGTIISSAIGYCMDEGVWAGREKFAQASMAQTRASSKALRNVLGWVAKLGGYKDTPAEEMDYQDQGITKAHTDKVVQSQNTPETAENGAECPECKGGMSDNKEINGQPKKSINYDKYVAEGKTRGLYQPLYKCLDKQCGGSIWEEPTEEVLPF